MSYLIERDFGSLSSYYGFITDKIEVYEKKGVFSIPKKLDFNCILITPLALGKNIADFEKIMKELRFEPEHRHIKDGFKLLIKKPAIDELKGLEIKSYFINTDNKNNSFALFSYITRYGLLDNDGDVDNEHIFDDAFSNLVFCLNSKNKTVLQKLDVILYLFPDAKEQLKEKFFFESNKKMNFEIDQLFETLFPYAVDFEAKINQKK